MRLRTLAPLGALALLPLGLAAQSGSASGTAAATAPSGAKRPPLPLKRRATPTAAVITTADLMSRLYVFADDSMMGREAGTIGHMKGTAYIAAEARRMGLVPAGDNGTYFQDVPFVSRTLSPRGTLTVGDRTLAAFTDYVALPFRGASVRRLDGTNAVYGGTMGDTSRSLTAAQAEGKLVIMRAATAGAGQGGRGAGSALAGAAAVAIVSDAGLPAALVRSAGAASLTIKLPAGAPAVPSTLYITPAAAATLLGAPLESAALGASGPAITGNLAYDEAAAPTRNVVAVLPGTDPKLKGQYVAVGAHSDHVGIRAAGAVDHDSLHAYGTQRWFASENPTGAPRSADAAAQLRARLSGLTVNVDSLRARRPARRDSINNGADDDGSGTVTVLEVAEAFARGRVKPKRSLLFVWHTAEEKGLLGSRWFTDNPTVPRDSIVAQINLDMVGRGAATDLAAGGERYLQLVGSRRLSTELGDLTEAVNRKEPMPFTFDYAFDANGHPDNIYCRSDHYNYARYGIPVVFMTTGLHGDYHQVTDEPQYIDYQHMARIANFVMRLTSTVAALDHRPVVDKPKPDPNGACRQ